MSAPAAAIAPVTGAGAAPQTARVAVLGARGYTGQAFVRLALAHPGLQVAALSSRDEEGIPAAAWLAGLDPRAAALPAFQPTSTVAAAIESGAFDTVIACLPHGAWRALQLEFPGFAHAARVVDLSSDHRAGQEGYCYGLPEAFRATLAGAPRIANPGCYATAATLALLPAVKSGWLAGPIVLSALSGVSGAGRGATLRTSFVEVHGAASFYRVGTEHAHVAEVEATLARLGDLEHRAFRPQIAFAPQLAPMARGILLVASAPLTHPLDPDAARAAWETSYENEPFVRVLPAAEWPETRAVNGSNRCDLAVTTVHDGATLMVTAALDNLIKGAAGQAVQNLNLQLGWPEDTGLPRHGNPT